MMISCISKQVAFSQEEAPSGEVTRWLAWDTDLKVVSSIGFFRIHGDRLGRMVATERLLAEVILLKLRKGHTTSGHRRMGVMSLLAMMVRTQVSTLVAEIFRATRRPVHDHTEIFVSTLIMELVCLPIVLCLAAHASVETAMRRPGEPVGEPRALAPAPAQPQ